jgi:15-cis-phytoene synthase
VLTPTLEAAYEVCETTTRNEARNFYYGIRLLPADRRAVLCSVYALARRIDDIGDGDLPAAEKAQRLADVRRRPGAHRAGRCRPPLSDPAGRLR